MADGPTVEVTAPDIAQHRTGNTGVPFAYSFAADEPGPHVMVTAVVHGNEIAGAIVLDRLLREGVKPTRGRLSLVFANPIACQRFDPAVPFASRFVEEDLNRVWALEVLEGRRRSVEIDRARALRPLVDTVDLLLDLHSMQAATAPLTLCGTTPRARQLAMSLALTPLVVVDRGHAAGVRLRDYQPFAAEPGAATALLVECGQHWAEASVQVAMRAVARTLAHAGIAALREPPLPATALPAMAQMGFPASEGAPRLIEVTHTVTITSDQFRFLGPWRGLEMIGPSGTPIAVDGGQPIRTPYPDCLLIMPARRLRPGQTAVRLGRLVP